MELNPLLRRAVDMGASDVHLKLGQPPVVRLDGDLDQVVDHPPLTEPDLESVLHAVTMISPRRREVFEKMRERGIGVQVNYLPVYWHPLFEDLGYKRGMCPNAERFYSEQLSLPLFADLTDDDQTRVIETLAEVLAS